MLPDDKVKQFEIGFRQLSKEEQEQTIVMLYDLAASVAEEKGIVGKVTVAFGKNDKQMTKS